MLIAHDEMGQFVEDFSDAMRIVDRERANDKLKDDLVIMEAADLPMLEIYKGRNATRLLARDVLASLGAPVLKESREQRDAILLSQSCGLELQVRT